MQADADGPRGCGAHRRGQWQSLAVRERHSKRVRYRAGPLGYLPSLTTGLRRSEIRSLRWADIDLTQATVTVRATATKNRRQNTLPLLPAVVVALRAAARQRPTTDPVVPRVPNMDTLRRDLRAAGIAYETGDGVIDFHALRVTFNTLLARAGVSLAQRQALMRHSDPKLTAGVYTRLEAADAIAAVSRIDPAAVTKLYVTSRASAHPGAPAGPEEPRSDIA